MHIDFGRGKRYKVESFDRLYAHHSKALHAYFLGRTSDPELALDLLQEVFLRVWRHLKSVPEDDHERQRYWLFAVAKNLVRDHFRREARVHSIAELLRIQTETTGATAQRSPELGFEAKESMEQVVESMERLPQELRTALVMHVLGELTSAEIGSLLDKPAGTVRYWIHRARQMIADDLAMSEKAGG